MRTRNSSFALLAVTAVASAMVVAGCSSKDRDPVPTPPAANQAPNVSAIANITANQDTVVPVDFGVVDDYTPANQVTVRAGVDGTTLFPADGVVLSGDGAVRKLTLTPLEATTGTAVVTVTAIDADGVMATRSFNVTVNARAASVRDVSLSTFAKGEAEAPTPVNGFTFTQDADETTFATLVAP